MKGKAIKWIGTLALGAYSMNAEPSAAENRFDVLAKTLAPIITVATSAGNAGNHAVIFEATAGEVVGLPAELIGAHLRVVFEFPDKLLVQFPIAGTTASICRNGQNVWAYPATLFGPLSEQFGPRGDGKPLSRFELDPAKAVLLPALLDVHDAGIVKLNNENFRVLDLRPLGEKKSWPGRLWIRDHRIAQLAVRFRDVGATLAVQKLDFAPALPAETWEPTAEQKDQTVPIPGDQITKLLQLALKQAH